MERAVHEPVAARIEENVMGDEVDLFFGLFFYLRGQDDDGAAMVLRRPGAVGAVVYFVVEAVMVAVWYRTAIVAGQARDSGAGVMLVVYAVVIGIGDGAAIVAGQAGDGPAGVVFVVDAVVIGIRDGAAMPGRRPGLKGAVVLLVIDAVVVGIAFPKGSGGPCRTQPDTRGNANTWLWKVPW
jgi:hypothetical protein